MLYPDFVLQEFSFEVEILPACAESSITQLTAITFSPLNRNQISTVDFAGFFTHDLDGQYSNYCGLIEYVFDASGPAQTYLNYDGSTSLTFEPLLTDAPGLFTHTLRV